MVKPYCSKRIKTARPDDAIMISIRPQWVDRIADGRKTVEVRTFSALANTKTERRVLMYETQNFGGCGEVVGEFMVKKVDSYPRRMREFPEEFLKSSNLTADEIKDYASRSEGVYGWHIDELVMYNHPRKLSAYKKPGTDEPILKAPQKFCYAVEKAGVI